MQGKMRNRGKAGEQQVQSPKGGAETAKGQAIDKYSAGGWRAWIPIT